MSYRQIAGFCQFCNANLFLMFPQPIPRMAAFVFHRRRRCHHRIYATVITSVSLKVPKQVQMSRRRRCRRQVCQ